MTEEVCDWKFTSVLCWLEPVWEHEKKRNKKGKEPTTGQRVLKTGYVLGPIVAHIFKSFIVYL